jgi:hypothetical protein
MSAPGSPASAIPAVPGELPPRRVAEALFPDAEIRYVDRFDAIADAFDRLDDQRPSTCGVYAARYLLAPDALPGSSGSAVPMAAAEDNAVDVTREDYLAWLAGTVLEPDEVAPADAARADATAAGLTDGEALARFPRTFYRWPLRVSDDPAAAGTSPAGVARAIGLASGGALVTLPIAGRVADGAVALSEVRTAALHDLLASRLDRWRVHPIANYQANQLLDPSSAEYLGLARGGAEAAAATKPPLDTWEVGHFAGIGALWTTAEGERWVLLLDSYKSRGWAGYEPQPVELLRRGLVRSDGREGGLLLVLPREHLDEAHAALRAIGLGARMWNNGSLEPESWTWKLGL